jgi:hypothetical protein
MTVVLTRVGYSISGSEMTVLRYLILEQIISHDELVLNWGILSVISLNDNFCGGHLMDYNAHPGSACYPTRGLEYTHPTQKID